MTDHQKIPPLVILGMDVGDDDYIQQWVREGYLPTIASIMERGWWGKTGGAEFICEYGLVASLFSGISRSEHGYYYFRQLKPGSYDLQNVSASDFKVSPFWSYLRHRGKKVLTIDVPEIDPVLGLPGLQLANWTTLHGATEPPLAEPAELLDEVERVFGPRMAFGTNYYSDYKYDQRIYQQLIERIEKKGRLCQHLLSRDQFDLTIMFFSEADIGSHQLWKYRPEAVNNESLPKENTLRHGIRNIYQAIDKQMGTLLKLIPKDANVIFLSLYGMQDEYPTSTLTESFCRQLGYQVTPQSGNDSNGSSISLNPLHLARRVIPESWRVAIGKCLPRETRERLLAEQFRSNTDWKQTTAFAIPGYYTGFIRVNLRGREPQGIVEPGADYEALLDQIEDDLKQLIDAKSGQPAVRRVGRTTELFQGSPPEKLPDLFVVWEPGPRLLQEVRHPRARLIQPKPEFGLDNQEKLAGFLAAAGPSFHQRGNCGEIDVLDLAPTFLSLLDQPIPPALVGNRPLNLLKPQE